MQKCGNAEIVMGTCECGDLGRCFWGRTQADWCAQGAGMCGELREWRGLRFSVDGVPRRAIGGGMSEVASVSYPLSFGRGIGSYRPTITCQPKPQ